MAEKIMLGGELVAELVAGPSAYEVAVSQGFVGSVQDWLDSLQGDPGVDGSDGLSAYQVAVAQGFVGTEAEWLASLKGDPGDDGIDGTDGTNGLSAYEVAVQGGFVGTEADWLASLQGADGEKGDKGDPGLSAYEVAVQGGFVGTQAEWLASLEGVDGLDGTDGINGLDGLSAYEVAVQEGFVGSEADWLASLKGEKGDQGDQGLSAYEVAVQGGFEGTEEEWVASLEGLSAYEVAVANGFVGSEAEWIASLEGEKGDKGDQGPPSVLTGEIKMVGGGVPGGYLPCDGSTVSRSEFPGLFSVVGTRFGSGDGVSTFGLPRFSGPLGLQGDFDLGGLTDLIEGTGDFETPDPDPSVAFTNLATNPSFETAGTPYDFYLNLIKNPRFVASGVLMEAYRNYHPNPTGVGSIGLTGWVGAGTNAVVASDQAVTWTPLGTARRCSWTTRDSQSGSFGVLPTALTFPATKTQRTVVWRFRASIAGTYRMIAVPGDDVVVNATSGHITVESGEVGTMWATYTPLINGGVPVQLRTDTANIRTGTGVWIEVSDVDAYEGAYQPNRPRFSGSYSSTPDLVPSWTGTVNNSPSILSGYRPSGSIGAAAGQGQNFTISDGFNGGTAQRFVAFTADPVGIPIAAIGEVASGTLYSIAMWVRSSHAISVLPRARSTYVEQHRKTLQPGVWTLVRTVVTAGGGGENQTGLLLDSSSGHVIGTTVDISVATVAAGNWPELEPFHGGYTFNPDLEPTWKGTVDASQSSVRGARANYAVPSGYAVQAYRSSQWSNSGGYSVCIDGSFSAADVPPEVVVALDPNDGLWPQVVPGKTYTAVALLRLTAPGGNAYRMRRIMLYTSSDGGTTFTESGSVAAPNQPGVHLVRWTFTIPANANRWILRLGGNGVPANGLTGDACRAWWDDLTIVEGTRPGLMPFHGGHSSIPDTVTRWTGTANASTSELLQNRSIYDPDRNAPCVAGPVTYQSSQSWSKSGSRSVLIDGSGQFSANEPDPFAVLTASTSLAHMAGGMSYTVVGWLRLVAAGDDFPMARRFVLKYDLGGQQVLEYGPQAFNGPGVYPLGAVFRVPEGASSVQVYLGGNGARPESLEDIGGVLAWWDDVKIVEGVHEHLLPDSSVGFVIKT